MLENLQVITIFIEGIISFFSPCIIPLIPLYMSYLAGSAKTKNKDGTITYKRTTTLIHTLFFVLGISASFFILGISFTALGQFFNESRDILLLVCGAIIITMGLFQTGLIKIPFLQKERKIEAKINLKKINPFMAFVLGFLFSFAWTPCVGPALSSVLMLASSKESMLIGNLYVLVYAMGFIIPFLILGLFTTEALNLLKKHQNFLTKLVKLGGILLIGIGCVLIYNGIEALPEQEANSCTDSGCGTDSNITLTNPVDFTLPNLNNTPIKLSDYQDKTVFLNFWSMTCNICKDELESIEKLFQEYQNKDVIILTIINLNHDHTSLETVENFIKEKGYTFPVLIDESSEVFNHYYVTSYPNSFIIKDNEIKIKVPGALSYEDLKSTIEKHK